MKWRWLLFVLPLLVWQAPASADAISDAVKKTHRSAANKSRDNYRHPLQTLRFFEVKPCHTVVELWPGALGWYTEILAPLLRNCGKLYTAHFSPLSRYGFYTDARKRFEQKLRADPAIYDRVVVTELQPPGAVTIAPAGSADRVLTFRNVHNWLKAGTEQAVFDAAYRALRPGGILGVVEHRADAIAIRSEMISSGYVTEAAVIDMARSAGFELLQRSDINANPYDYHDHPEGVWTLPPAMRLGNKDKRRYLAIGESDRMTLKFIKP